MVAYEDYKAFSPVTVLTSKPGKMLGIGSAYDAAKFMLEQWPDIEGPKLSNAKHIMLKCLAGECSAAVARVAFVEAAREANIYIEPFVSVARIGGKPQKWGKRRYPRRS